MENRPPCKVLLGHGLVRDQWDRPMHKSAGNAIPFEGAADEGYTLTDPKGVTERYPPMSADLIRWMFCRHNPANNLDFGPGPAEELRSKFTLKLWNSYAFFCNYARLDGFDPAKQQVPIKDRSVMDRWILSDLQKLVQSARKAFEEFNVQAFCLETERFVDDKLSNWYVRRERRRFWKEEKGSHKWAAYQTLHTVLVTLTKLFAPIMPFLSEAMYRNLKCGKNGESVHLCDFPEADEDLIDTPLSENMEALLRLTSLGSAARNLVKIKVRQRLKSMRVQPRDEKEAQALQPHLVPMMRDELNFKEVESATLRTKARLNMQRAGQRFGPKVKEVEGTLAQQDSRGLFEQLQVRGVSVELQCPSGIVQLEPADVIFEFDPSGPEEGWVGLVDRGTVIAFDPHITEELRLEGLAREVVRHVQSARKNAGLEIEDRIVVHLGTDSTELRKAIDEHAERTATREGEPWLGIKGETLATELSPAPLDGHTYKTSVKVDGHPLTIELRKEIR